MTLPAESSQSHPAPELLPRWAPWLRPGLIEHAFDAQRVRFDSGRRLHVAFSAVLCFGAALPIALAEFCAAPLLVLCFIRLARTLRLWRMWVAGALMPAVLCLVAFAAWMAVTALWSPNQAGAWSELSKLRWIWIPILIFPALESRGVLVAALCLGLLAGNGAQALTAIGMHYGIDALVHPLAGNSMDWARAPDRNGGWWHPLIGGSMLVAAFGLHLPAAFMGHGRVRRLAIAGASISLLGIFASGTRSAMLGALVLFLITSALAVIRALRPQPSVHHSFGNDVDSSAAPPTPAAPRARPVLLASALVLALGVGTAALVAGDSIVRRTEAAWHDVRGAIDRRDFSSDNGARLLMAWWAIEAVGQRPLGGIGAGGYSEWCRQHLIRQGIDPASRRIFEHAHNSLLHIASTTGLIGASLALGVIVCAIAGSLHALFPGELGTYAAGPAFALIGLALVSPLDPVHFNSQTGLLLILLIGLCPAWLPRAIRDRRAPDPLPRPAAPVFSGVP